MKVQELCFIAGWNSSQLLMTSWAREMWFDAIQGVIPQFMSFASASLISFCLLPAIHFQLSSNAVPSLSWPCGKANDWKYLSRKETLFFLWIRIIWVTCLQHGLWAVVWVQLKVTWTAASEAAVNAGGCPNVKWFCCQQKSALGPYPGWRGFTSHSILYWTAVFHFILFH